MSWPILPHEKTVTHSQSCQLVKKTEVEASTLACYEFSSRFLHLLVEGKSLRTIQQPRMPAKTASQLVPASTWLNEVVNWDGKSLDINRVLTAAFGSEDYLDCIRNLQAQGIDPLSYINSLDKVCMHSVSTQRALSLTILG